MKKEKGYKAPNNGKKIRRLKFYLALSLTALITLATPLTGVHTASTEDAREQVMKMSDPKQYARSIAKEQYGWTSEQYKCLGILWGKESAWNFQAESPTQDYGIPQRHMRKNTQEEIDAFMQNPQTQIKWGLNYIEKRYGSPCEAWEFWSVNRWY